jgi:hypothetical protein
LIENEMWMNIKTTSEWEKEGGRKAKTTIKISVNWFLLRCLFYFGEIFYSLAARADFFVNLRSLVHWGCETERVNKINRIFALLSRSLYVVTCAYADILPFTNLPSFSLSLFLPTYSFEAIKKLLNYHRVEGWKIG